MSEESRTFTVMVPCSTSNIGAGFDAIGIALSGPDMMVRVKPGGELLRITRLSGEGEERLPPDATNRVIQAAHQAAASAGRDAASLAAELEIHSSIPLKRGLGSSAAAPLAGALITAPPPRGGGSGAEGTAAAPGVGAPHPQICTFPASVSRVCPHAPPRS